MANRTDRYRHSQSSRLLSLFSKSDTQLINAKFGQEIGQWECGVVAKTESTGGSSFIMGSRETTGR